MKFLSAFLDAMTGRKLQTVPREKYDERPKTLQAQEAEAQSGRPRVFDPALKHHARAFQLGDYLSASAHERLEWEMARAQVRAHLLQLVANSRWRDHLVLRGSALMQAWFGEAARDPRDLDWVFIPHDVEMKDDLAQQCFAELKQMATDAPRVGATEILAERIAWDDIWTYERAAGRRLIFPFQTPSGARREIQMDIVWGEVLWQDPVFTAIPTRGDLIEVWAATPTLSLAWKLLWLANDMHAQGKDLYDAVLLAEHAVSQGTPLEFALLRQVFGSDQWWAKRNLTLEDFRNLDVDWESFTLDYPFVEGDEKHWKARLLAALQPTFDASG